MTMLDQLAVVAIVVGVLSPGCTGSVEETPFRITSTRDNDRVEVQVQRGTTVFSIHSPMGISQAVIERTDENWPDIVMLQLHLKGLENFHVSNGIMSLSAAVSSQDGKVRLWKDADEDSPLTAQSPCWTTIRMFGDDGQQTATVPLVDGYFEIQLPKALLENNPKSMTVKWIDFYR